MPRIEPLPLTEIEPSLASAIKQAQASGVLSSTVPLQIWAHRPVTAAHWLDTLNSFYQGSQLSERLRELVRLKIASITRCDVCQLARKSDTVDETDIVCMANDIEHFPEDIRAALAFAELFAADYTAIGEVEFSALRCHFSTEAIVELNMFCALMLAGGRMTYVLRGYEDEL
jgi:alkylhydroperoxidase family enzyme